jgi:transcriptional regulator with XRE-family HTH domain
VPRKQPADYDPTDVALGGALRVARIRLGLEQEAVGLTLGSPTPGAAQRLVSRLESGEQTWTASNVLTVARALGTTTHDLLVQAGLAPSRRPALDEALATDVTMSMPQRQALAALIDTFRSVDPAELRSRRPLGDIIADIPGISDADRKALEATVKQRQRAARRRTD